MWTVFLSLCKNSEPKEKIEIMEHHKTYTKTYTN